MELKILSSLLVKRRRELSLSQTEVAEFMGVSQQAYRKWEAGETMPRSAFMVRVAEFLGISKGEAILSKTAQKNAIQIASGKIALSPESDNFTTPGASLLSQDIANATSKDTNGYALLAMLATALQNGILRQHQINTLGSLVDSFVISSTK